MCVCVCVCVCVRCVCARVLCVSCWGEDEASTTVHRGGAIVVSLVHISLGLDKQLERLDLALLRGCWGAGWRVRGGGVAWVVCWRG